MRDPGSKPYVSPAHPRKGWKVLEASSCYQDRDESEAARTGDSLKASASRLQTALWSSHTGRPAGSGQAISTSVLSKADCFEGLEPNDTYFLSQQAAGVLSESEGCFP